ncbi:hypothetical protein RA307_25365 [Xanthobacteraceae bacterium Astr-EGSB]|jgi:hypothetical protein|uniref:hypothetical protein n=1 Tax=Astrobacterium formosum TaxID=3069710 RepID=UPI0027B26EE4|nr:hypothetical protein [Xanthobacteraceae bacterium Astr-EGSB]
MGTVITFPEVRHITRAAASVPRGSATIIILPVIRIEHQDDEPSDGFAGTAASVRKRRRRATRS